MANEFKVRKGLIVQGSGSTGDETILDVQGNQGQLFSITDSLIGDIFTVSDISGIPILNVSSSGIVEAGTFGNYGLIVNGSNITSSGNISASGVLQIKNITGSGDIAINGFSSVSASLAAAVAGGGVTSITAGEGIDVDQSTGAVEVSGEDATTSNKGIAKFNTANFSVNSGDVTIKSGGVDLTDEVTGTLPVANGGTNATSFADKSVIITQDTGTDTLAAVAMSSNGQLLIGGTSGPAVATITEGHNISITNGDGSITIEATTSSLDSSGVISSSVLSSATQGTALLTVNGVAGSTVDLGLETTDNVQFANLTATGNTTLGNATGDQHTFTGHITTSGNINVEDPGIYQIEGVNAIDYASTTHLFGSNTSFTKLRTQKGLEVTAPITASHAISASGFIKTDSHITASGNITGSTISGNTIRIPQTSGNSFFASLYFGSSPSGNNGVIYDDENKMILGYDDTDILEIRSANPHVAISTKVRINADSGHITASGNISASGTIIGNTGTFNDLGHVTASGNISSSKAVIANGIRTTVGGGINLGPLDSTGIFLKNDTQTQLTIAQGNDINTPYLTINPNEVIVPNNISASGKIITEEIEGNSIVLDSAGDIELNADGADIILKDATTEFGRFKRDSSDFVIKASTNNEDLIFKGIDNSATITALTLDMSEAGNATFNNDISASGGIAVVKRSKFGMGVGNAFQASHQFQGISGDTNFFLIFDEDGEEVMKGVGSAAGGNLTYQFGDNGTAANGTFFEVADGTNNGQFKLRNDGNNAKVGINIASPENVAGLEVVGRIKATNITASGTISASGFIKTDSHITASGQISSSGTGENYFGGDINLMGADLIIENNQKIQFENTGGSEFGNIFMNSNNNMLYQNLKSNGDINLKAGNGGNEGNVIIMPGGATTVIAQFGETQDLYVKGHVTASSHIYALGALGVGTTTPTTTGLIRATNDVVAFYSSDERLKENILELSGSVDKISQIRGVEFDWVPKEGVHENEGHDIGVIAQEIEKVFPEVVQTRENGYKAVKYDKLTAVLISAIKELKAEIDELKKK